MLEKGEFGPLLCASDDLEVFQDDLVPGRVGEARQIGLDDTPGILPDHFGSEAQVEEPSQEGAGEESVGGVNRGVLQEAGI